jgi:hypothetical protein
MAEVLSLHKVSYDEQQVRIVKYDVAQRTAR